jgi:opine dehydrogenase
MSKIQIAVIGGGHGGHAMAALLGRAGHAVRLYDRYPEAVAAVAERRTVRFHGIAGQGEVPVGAVTTDLAEAVRGADLVMVVVPAFAHAYLAETMAPHLGANQVVLLNTGSSGSALEFQAVLRREAAGKRVVVGETDTLVYTCRLTGPGEVRISAVKPRVKIATLPRSGLEAALGLLASIYPQLQAVPNVLWTTLGNISPIEHLPATLLNVALVERTRGDYLFWRDSITPSVSRMIEILDTERMAAAQALGVGVETLSEWLSLVYGVSGADAAEKILTNPAYAEVRGPADLRHRFVSEDIPMGLLPMAELARVVGVPTPGMDTMIRLAELLNGEDYRSAGRTLSRMGLLQSDRSAILDYVNA